MLVRFQPRSDFARTLEARVDALMATTDPVAARRAMISKTVLILLWAVTSYVGLVFWAQTWWQALPLSVSLGFALAGIGFSIMHDANHGSYPVGPRLRRALGFLIDMMGGSSYVWIFQHNINHHTFTNVVGADNDINIGLLARLAPTQRRRPWHRLQQFYMWPFYSLLGVMWIVWSDWRDVAVAKVGTNSFPRPRGWELVLFILGKVFWLTFWVIVPLSQRSPAQFAAFLMSTYMVLGLTMAVVFQLAHAVEEADFPALTGEPALAPDDFARHQVATTVDFAPGNASLSWYLGGLNFQVEHHLFPKVCHVHYPRIAAVVEATCREFGVQYRSIPTFGAAFLSHVRWLIRMGRPEPVTG